MYRDWIRVDGMIKKETSGACACLLSFWEGWVRVRKPESQNGRRNPVLFFSNAYSGCRELHIDKDIALNAAARP